MGREGVDLKEGGGGDGYGQNSLYEILKTKLKLKIVIYL